MKPVVMYHSFLFQLETPVKTGVLIQTLIPNEKMGTGKVECFFPRHCCIVPFKSYMIHTF
jgi:hypothetical protein